jgi:hypothetical protein
MNNSDLYLLIGTPCYGGKLYEGYFKSMIELNSLLMNNNIKFDIFTIASESLITRARNSIVAKFIGNKKFTHLLFIDADIVFDAMSIISMLSKNKDIIGGCYPKKNLNIENLKNTIKSNETLSNEDIERKSLRYVINFLPEEIDENKTNIKIEIVNGCSKVTNIGTGFLLIKRNVFDKLIENYPDSSYINDVEGYDNEFTRNNFYTFFDTMVHPVSKRYLSEDYAFCQKWLDIGGEIWCDLSVNLAHIGNCTYNGSFYKFIESSIK